MSANASDFINIDGLSGEIFPSATAPLLGKTPDAHTIANTLLDW